MLLKDIQNKPKSLRVKIFVLILSVAFIFLFIWWLTASINEIKSVSKNSANKQNKNSSLPGISESLKAGFKDIFSGDEIKLK